MRLHGQYFFHPFVIPLVQILTELFTRTQNQAVVPRRLEAEYNLFRVSARCEASDLLESNRREHLIHPFISLLCLVKG